MPAYGNDDDILGLVLEAMAIDQNAGGLASLESYQQRFEGYEDTVAQIYRDLVGEAAPTEPTRARTEGQEAVNGAYTLLRLLGTGGMGEVWLAEQNAPRRVVALKRIRRDAMDEGTLARFRHEAELLGRIDHQGIARVHEAGVDEAGRPFIAMAYVPGRSLADLLVDLSVRREGAPAPPALGRDEMLKMLQLLETVARSIHCAHERGIIHRDLKPNNIQVADDGAPVILDFGLARDTGGDQPSLTRTGAIFGTPAYLSPEQISQVQGRVDRRADVWALGVTLYECVSLRRPFRGTSREALYRSILQDDPEPVDHVHRNLPRDLRAVVQKALEKNRDHRYQTALELAEDLERVRTGRPVAARSPGPWLRAARWAQRNLGVSITLGIFVLALVVSTAISLFLAARSADRLESWRRMADLRLLEELRQEADELWPAWPHQAPSMERWLRRAREVLSHRPNHLRTLAAVRAGALPYTAADRTRDFETHDRSREYREVRAEIEDAERTIPRIEGEIGVLEAKDEESDLSRQEGLLLQGKEETLRETKRALAVLRTRLPELEVGRSQRRTWRFPETEQAYLHDLVSQLTRELEEFSEPERGLVARMVRRHRLATSVRQQTVVDHAEDWMAAATRLRTDARFQGLTLTPQMGLVPMGPDERSGLEEFCVFEGADSIPKRDSEGHFTLRPEHGVVLVLVPGGRFSMGAQASDPATDNYDPEASPNEAPVHAVTLAPFFISKFEMTQAQWTRRTGSNPSLLQTERTEESYGDLNPVEQVSVDDCERQLRSLGLQIPTEAQWEYACRADQASPWWCGTTSAAIQTAHAGNIADLRASLKNTWACSLEVDDGFTGHAPVGSFSPNGFGLHDVLGNVLEWCLDTLAPYEAPPSGDDGLRRRIPGRDQILRGGAFCLSAERSRSAVRIAVLSDLRADFIGVRPVRRLQR